MPLKLRAILFHFIILVQTIIFYIIFEFSGKFFNYSQKFRYNVTEYYSYLFIFFLKICCNIGFEVENIDLIPKDGQAFIAIGNHQSFWENFIIQLIFPYHSWVVKKELYNILLFGAILKSANPIAIDRNDSRSVMKIIKEGNERLENGESLVIFPESTRVAVGKDVAFKTSAAKLALKSKKPILLFAHNAGLFWPKGFWFKKAGVIKIKIIEYLDYEDYKQMDNVRILNNYIQEKIISEKNYLARVIPVGLELEREEQQLN